MADVSYECTHCGLSRHQLAKLNLSHGISIPCCDMMNFQPRKPPHVDPIDGAAIDFWHSRHDKFMNAEVP